MYHHHAHLSPGTSRGPNVSFSVRVDLNRHEPTMLDCSTASSLSMTPDLRLHVVPRPRSLRASIPAAVTGFRNAPVSRKESVHF